MVLVQAPVGECSRGIIWVTKQRKHDTSHQFLAMLEL